MEVPAWLPRLLMVLATILILRATGIVVCKGGRAFRADPLVTMVLGLGLVLLAQYLFSR